MQSACYSALFHRSHPLYPEILESSVHQVTPRGDNFEGAAYAEALFEGTLL